MHSHTHPQTPTHTHTHTYTSTRTKIQRCARTHAQNYTHTHISADKQSNNKEKCKSAYHQLTSRMRKLGHVKVMLLIELSVMSTRDRHTEFSAVCSAMSTRREKTMREKKGKKRHVYTWKKIITVRTRVMHMCM